MENKEILEGNKLIAEFMGIKNPLFQFPTSGHGVPFAEGQYLGTDGLAYYPEDMRYHSDWNWLMPVVDKIEQLPSSGGFFFTTIAYQHNIREAYVTEIYGRFFGRSENSKLEATFMSVIGFIKWYNKASDKDKNDLLSLKYRDA